MSESTPPSSPSPPLPPPQPVPELAQSDGTGAATATATAPRTKPTPARVQPPKQWNVVLLDDDDHTFDYVIELAQKLFRVPIEHAMLIAKAVHEEGRAVCMTTHKELAELKRDQIHGFGVDPQASGCKGSMSSIIEPVD